MSDRLDEFADNTLVVLVTFSDPKNLAEYAAKHNLSFAVLIDADRQVYREFGLGRGSVWRVWGWKAARRYYQIWRGQGLALFAGLRRPREDTLQLGGDFVIDPDGTLVYEFRGAGPDDRPTVDELIQATWT